MDVWLLIHRFNRLAKQGLVAPVTCPDCKHPVTFLAGEGDQPIMWCAWDNGRFLPGAAFFADMRAVVSEHYLE